MISKDNSDIVHIQLEPQSKPKSLNNANCGTEGEEGNIRDASPVKVLRSSMLPSHLFSPLSHSSSHTHLIELGDFSPQGFINPRRPQLSRSHSPGLHTVALDWMAPDPDWNHRTNVVFGHSWSVRPTAGCLLLGCFSLPDTRGREWGQLPRYSSDGLTLSAPRSDWNISQCWYLESEPRNNTCSPSGLIALTNEWLSLFFSPHLRG